MTTRHDQMRLERAQACDLDDLESLEAAIRGLQSTDDPDPQFRELHDKLESRYRELKGNQCLNQKNDT